MDNHTFGVISFSVFVGAAGALLAFKPSAISRMTNAYYALIRMKSRLAEDDYDKIGVRIAGGLIFLLAIYVLITRGLFR